MEASEVKKYIEDGIPGAEAMVTADGNKYNVVVVSPEFEGKTILLKNLSVSEGNLTVILTPK